MSRELSGLWKLHWDVIQPSRDLPMQQWPWEADQAFSPTRFWDLRVFGRLKLQYQLQLTCSLLWNDLGPHQCSFQACIGIVGKSRMCTVDIWKTLWKEKKRRSWGSAGLLLGSLAFVSELEEIAGAVLALLWSLWLLLLSTLDLPNKQIQLQKLDKPHDLITFS